LLDTDVIIQWLRGVQEIKDKIERFIREGVTLVWTPIQIAEIFAGMRKGEEEIISNLFFIFDSLFLNDDIGKKAGEYMRKYSKSHALEIADALTAATASYYRVHLWTLNSRHFPMRDIKFVKI
jgi:hypothetical protein